MTTQEVIKSLRMIKSTCYIGNRKFLDALEQAVEMLEAQEWIPVSERLPERSGKYIVTVFDGVTDRISYVHFHRMSGVWDLFGKRAYWKVTAWMPLPEPYRAERRTDERFD